jgi:hypothetical protein
MHGVGYGTNDKSNEPVEPPSIVAKDKQEHEHGEGPINNSMLQMLGDQTLFKRMSKLVSLAYQKKHRFFYLKVFCKKERQNSKVTKCV